MTAIERLKASQKFGKVRTKEKRKQVARANGMEPVDWRGQHGDVVDDLTDDESPAPVKRVQAPLERLWKRGTLDDAQYVAGKRLHSAYALGLCGARDPEAKSSGEARLSFGLAGAQLIALEEYREAKTALGVRLWPWVDWIVNKDIPLADLARDRGRNPTEVAALLKIGLDMVGDAFAEMDNRTRREVKRA